MTTNLISSGTTAREKVNLRTPEVVTAVQEQVESHYRSDIVDKVRRAGGILSFGDVTVRLAKQFGFCYGVERAIDLAYAARKVFKDRRLFIVGEIIHNPEVNEQISSLGIKNLMGKNKQAEISDLQPEDVVIVPAFGTELSTLQQIKERGCQIVDTTCSGASGRRSWIEMGRSWRQRIFASSIRFAARRRNVRMRCASCSTSRWTSYSWWAVITARTHRIWPRWARKSCPPISCSTPRVCFQAMRSSITTCTRNVKSSRKTGCRVARSWSASPRALPVRII